MKKVLNIVLSIMLLLPCLTQAQERPSVWWKSSGQDSINNHTAQIFRDSTAYVDSITASESIVIISVYKNITDTTESSVWHMMVNDSARYGITTEKLYTEYSTIRYRPYKTSGPIINTTQMTIPQESVSNQYHLYAGKMGDIESKIEMAELMCFNKMLLNTHLLSIQSYMAIKYGAMLGKVNYLDGHNNVVWDYSKNKLYHHRITGVATDSVYGLQQTISRNQCDSSILTLISDTLNQGEYIIIGDNNGTLDFEDIDGINYLNRVWKMQITSTIEDQPLVDILLDTTLIQHSGGDSLQLVIGEHQYLPQRRSGGLYYSHVMVPTDTAFIYFAKGLPQEDVMLTHFKEESEESNIEQGEPNTIIKVYPNPTKGQYSILVSNARAVEASIYDTKGTLVKTYNGKGSQNYSFNGILPQGQTYYVVVKTDNLSETIKMIVE